MWGDTDSSKQKETKSTNWRQWPTGSDSIFVLQADVQRFQELNFRAEQKRDSELKWGFHCLRVQTVTEATVGKNTQLSRWKHGDTTDRQRHKPEHSSLSTMGSQRDSASYWPETTWTFCCPEVRRIRTSYIHHFKCKGIILSVNGSTYLSNLF